jgi:hypothetical protein
MRFDLFSAGSLFEQSLPTRRSQSAEPAYLSLNSARTMTYRIRTHCRNVLVRGARRVPVASTMGLSGYPSDRGGPGRA